MFVSCGEIVEIRIMKDQKGSSKVPTTVLSWIRLLFIYLPFELSLPIIHLARTSKCFLLVSLQGFGFVRFSTKEATFKALKEKNGCMVNDILHKSSLSSMFPIYKQSIFYLPHSILYVNV